MVERLEMDTSTEKLLKLLKQIYIINFSLKFEHRKLRTIVIYNYQHEPEHMPFIIIKRIHVITVQITSSKLAVG